MMRGDSINSGVRTGVVLSVILHAGVAFVASTVPFDGESGLAGTRAGVLSGSAMSLDIADPSVLPPTPDPMPETKPLTALLVPSPEVAPPQLTPEEIERKLVLGIDESDQKTPNWMGFRDPTPHSAPLSSVEQPLLDPNPGTPGAPTVSGSSQNGPQTQLVPNALPANETVQPTPPEPRTPREGVKAPESALPTNATPRPGEKEGGDHPASTTPREGDKDGTGEKHTRPIRGTPDQLNPNPALPGPAPEDRGVKLDPPVDPATPESEKPETPKKIEPAKEAAPATEIMAQPEVTVPLAPGTPNTNVSTTPTAPMPAGGPTVSSTPGATGERPGEQSPKEADASSTTPAVEIRPGRPAAAQGLDITTKRPNFTRLTRVTAYPQNPLLKVTFNRHGIVSRVVVAESSGIPDVDGPVVNAVYQWTAKGKILAEISPKDAAGGITVNVRILLR